MKRIELYLGFGEERKDEWMGQNSRFCQKCQSFASGICPGWSLKRCVRSFNVSAIHPHT